MPFQIRKLNSVEGIAQDVNLYSSYLTAAGALMTICSIGLFFFEIYTDVTLSIQYYDDKSTSFFALTLFFIIFPAVVIAAFNIILYIDRGSGKTSGSALRVIQITLSLLNLSIFLRYVGSIYWSYKIVVHRSDTVRRKKFVKKLDQEDADGAFLGFLDAFLEGASQLTLQLYIVLIELPIYGWEFYSGLQGMKIVLAFAGLSFSLLSFNRTLRQVQDNKAKLPLLSWSSILLFMWQLCVTLSRIAILALFASAYPQLKILLPVAGLHWFIMYLWILRDHNQPQPEEPDCTDVENYSVIRNVFQILTDQFLYVVFAYIYIFVYFNTLDKPTRRNYLFYYTICTIEGALLLGFTLTLQRNEDYFDVYANIGYISSSSYFAGILLMIIYFKWFHPSLSKPRQDQSLATVSPQNYDFYSAQLYIGTLQVINYFWQNLKTRVRYK